MTSDEIAARLAKAEAIAKVIRSLDPEATGETVNLLDAGARRLAEGLAKVRPADPDAVWDEVEDILDGTVPAEVPDQAAEVLPLFGSRLQGSESLN